MKVAGESVISGSNSWKLLLERGYSGMKERLLDVMKWGLIIVIAGVVFYFVAPTHQFQAVWLIITAVAIAAIAFYAIQSHSLAGKSYQLALEINSANELKARREDELRQQISDLCKALVIASLIKPEYDVGSEQWKKVVAQFKNFYNGKTPIL
jgi:hypothetical protein